ncbi:hypothetical protein DRO41_00860 [Candidatus Bathyarchaeota archaeon]|nr:MAG: hypothetical protein DRO41_00860 [Candidatus Bathyarchaeota archaeon]
MPRFLTRLLANAVPDVYVKSATVIRALPNVYWILVDPDHEKYWERFGEIYPHWKQVAFTYHVRKDSLGLRGFCPEFDDLENLLNWLFEVLELPQGERNLLLLLCKGCKRCRKF